jgi:hypothetical protein
MPVAGLVSGPHAAKVPFGTLVVARVPLATSANDYPRSCQVHRQTRLPSGSASTQ